MGFWKSFGLGALKVAPRVALAAMTGGASAAVPAAIAGAAAEVAPAVAVARRDDGWGALIRTVMHIVTLAEEEHPEPKEGVQRAALADPRIEGAIISHRELFPSGLDPTLKPKVVAALRELGLAQAKMSGLEEAKKQKE